MTVIDFVQPAAQWAAAIIEGIGVLIITVLAIYLLGQAAVRLVAGHDSALVYQTMRRRLGQGILLGLEFLVAADIIATVVLDLTFESIAVLAAVVLIRTFLSFTLEVELTGRWPWQGREE